MVRKRVDADDPFVLVGQGFPVSDGEDSLGEMARCFIEEYALLGFSGSQIARIFRSPHYQGPHGVYLARGAEYVVRLIREVLNDLMDEEQVSAASL